MFIIFPVCSSYLTVNLIKVNMIYTWEIDRQRERWVVMKMLPPRSEALGSVRDGAPPSHYLTR